MPKYRIYYLPDTEEVQEAMLPYEKEIEVEAEDPDEARDKFAIGAQEGLFGPF